MRASITVYYSSSKPHFNSFNVLIILLLIVHVSHIYDLLICTYDMHSTTAIKQFFNTNFSNISTTFLLLSIK